MEKSEKPKKRKNITKKVRFEVFKRDLFTCQYCGRMSPDVVLEVDHIVPVSKGGDNELLNLVTSCFDCNRGKSDKKLSDDSSVKVQQAELKKLGKKREQIEMIAKWKNECSMVSDMEVEVVSDLFNDFCENKFSMSASFKKKLKQIIVKYGLNEVLDATEIAMDKYYRDNSDSANEALSKIGGICYNRKQQKENPIYSFRQRAFYSIRRNLRYVNDSKLLILIEKNVCDEDDMNYIISFSKKCNNWTEFIEGWELDGI